MQRRMEWIKDKAMTRMAHITTAIAIGLGSSLALGASASEVTKQYPVRDFFKKPERSTFRLSPDGQFLSFLQPYKGRQNVFVQRIGSTEAPVAVTAETARDVGGYFWKGNDRIMYVKDFGGDENYHVVSVNRDGSDLKDLTPYDKVRAEVIDDLEDVDEFVLISHNHRNAEVADVFRVNLATGESKLIAEKPGQHRRLADRSRRQAAGGGHLRWRQY